MTTQFQYETLNDVPGEFFKFSRRIEIWYRPFNLRHSDYYLGNHDALVSTGFVKIGSIQGCFGLEGENLAEAVFEHMQGENWSMLGQANTMIRNLGADHTSMSVGDVIVIEDHAWSVQAIGFSKLW